MCTSFIVPSVLATEVLSFHLATALILSNLARLLYEDDLAVNTT